MAATTVPIDLPEALFLRLKRAAELTHRSVEDLAATTLEAALPLATDLPLEIAQELAAMHVFSDDALWEATVPSLAPTEAVQLRQLNRAAGERSLTPVEQAHQERLIMAYRYAVLRRAQALALLAQRGHSLPASSALDMADDGEC